jgi:cytochrome c-type protein NapB
MLKIFNPGLFTGLLFGVFVSISGCTDGTPGRGSARSVEVASIKTPALERATRRLFDGAPPVIPHPPMGAACTSCHNREGMRVEGLGFSPPSPHELTAGMSALSRCQQCHVFQQTEEPWVGNTFVGLPQDLRQGSRLYEGAPPVMPHSKLMRENCQACHAGEAAREEIRTSHPERFRCMQCHVEQVVGTTNSFP